MRRMNSEFKTANMSEEGQKLRKAPRGRKLRLRKGCAYLFRMPRFPGKAAPSPVRRRREGKKAVLC